MGSFIFLTFIPACLQLVLDTFILTDLRKDVKDYEHVFLQKLLPQPRVCLLTALMDVVARDSHDIDLFPSTGKTITTHTEFDYSSSSQSYYVSIGAIPKSAGQLNFISLYSLSEQIRPAPKKVILAWSLYCERNHNKKRRNHLGRGWFRRWKLFYCKITAETGAFTAVSI